jgi:hypothetical protein
MGRGILDKGVLYRDSRRAWGRRSDRKIVRNQGRKPEEYEKIYENKQLELFD